MKHIHGTPYCGLTCEIWTYDSTKDDKCGSLVTVLFKNKLMYFPVYVSQITSGNDEVVITSQDNEFYNGKVLNPLLLDWISIRADNATSAAALFENKTRYFPAVETYETVIRYGDWRNYVLKWYNDGTPTKYIVCRDRDTWLFEDGAEKTHADIETGISLSFTCYIGQATGYVSVPAVDFNTETGEINVRTDLTLRRYGSTVYTQMKSRNQTPERNALLNDFLNSLPDWTADPYDPGGTTEPAGGEGTFDGTSEDVDIPPLPAFGAVDTGFITLYNPTLNQLNDLASYMWSGAFDPDTFKKLFADPMDAIIGLSIVPVDVPAGGLSSVKVGNADTGVQMTKAGGQYVTIDCGSIEVKEFFGAYLDYAPYTRCEIYLPYIGTHPLNADEVMRKTVHVVYHVDILSGACTAYVKCGGSVLYTFNGQCAAAVPITGSDWTNTINGILSLAGSVGSMVATGGASAPTAIPSMAQTAVNALKPSIEKSGALAGGGGLMAIQTPYLIITRPRQALPADQNGFMGYPALMTETLQNLSGYTEIESIHIEGIPGTTEEVAEIVRLLKEGVIL